MPPSSPLPATSAAASNCRRLMILTNPAAGKAAGRASRLRDVEAARNDFERHGLQVEVESDSTPEALGDRAAAAVDRGCQCIVAAGGDGTINAVVNGLMLQRERSAAPPTSVTLGILPTGTGNVLAFNLGIGKSWRAACRVIKEGHLRCIDVGLATSDAPSFKNQRRRYFLLMAGVGFDAKVIEDTSLRLKYVLRDFAYVLKTLQNVVQHRGAQMTLTFDDGRVYANEAWLVMVGNAASYAWDIKVTTHARLDDGMLDVCLMPFENKLVSIQQAMQILTGQHIDRGSAEYWKVKSVRIESRPCVPVQLDGDEWASTTVDLTVVPAALQVLAPPESLSG